MRTWYGLRVRPTSRKDSTTRSNPELPIGSRHAKVLAIFYKMAIFTIIELTRFHDLSVEDRRFA